MHDQGSISTASTPSGGTPPLVSVIMPAYNAAPYIRDSVATVLGQDHRHLELIIVDDGSSDGTPELVEGLDPRITVLRQKNAGPAAARNLGLQTAKGDFIAFLDADDLWTPRKLSLQLQYLQQHPDVGLVYGGFIRWHARADGGFDAPPLALGQTAPDDAIEAQESGWIYVPLLFGGIVHIITAMIRREVIEQVGVFNAQLPTGEDYDFWLRVSRQFKAAKLARTLALYRIHRAGITNKPQPESNEYRVLRSALEAWGPCGPDGSRAPDAQLRSRLFMLNFSHGYQHAHGGSARIAARSFWRALQLQPFHLKSWVYLTICGFKRLGEPAA